MPSAIESSPPALVQEAVRPAAAESPKPPQRSSVNQSIQGMRGAAAVAVLGFHLHGMGQKILHPEADAHSPYWNVGPYAVMLFFCISGYLIVSTLVKHGDVKRFAINRVARIYPLFFILHLIMFTAGPLAGYEWMGALRHDPLAYIGHFLSNLLFLPGMADLPIAQKNAWSLSYEAAFYVVAGIAFSGIQRWRETSGRITAVLGALCAVAALCYYPSTIFFAAGTLTWWLERRGKLSWPDTGPLSLLCLLGGLVLFSQGHTWLTALVVLPFFCDVVRQQGWVSRFFQLPAVVWLGTVSYSLYLTHPFVLSPLQRIAMKLTPALGGMMAQWLFVITAGALALVAAGLSYALIEVRLTRRLMPPRRSRAQISQAAAATP